MADGIERWTPALRNSVGESCRQSRAATRGRRWWSVGYFTAWATGIGSIGRMCRESPMSLFCLGGRRSSFTGASGTAMAARRGVCRSRASTTGKPKLNGNKERDKRQEEELRSMGWGVLVIWQCETANLEVLAQTPTAASSAAERPDRASSAESGRHRIERQRRKRRRRRETHRDRPLCGGRRAEPWASSRPVSTWRRPSRVDPVHCAVHEFNFPHTTTIPHPVETLYRHRYPGVRRHRWAPGRLRVRRRPLPGIFSHRSSCPRRPSQRARARLRSHHRGDRTPNLRFSRTSRG